MPRYHRTSKGRIPFTPEEEIAANIKDAVELEKQANEKPINDWIATMAESDKVDMSREMEDHIKDHHNGIAGNEYSQSRYDRKQAKRAQKPKL